MEFTYLTHASELDKIDPHVMAMGFFDGVHLGHQELFDEAKKHAARLGIKSSALTFSPHPDEVIKDDVNRKYITPLEEKIEKISQCGIDHIFVMKFDEHFASLSPREFIEKYIYSMNTRHVVVGFDFTFGRKAAGNTARLEAESGKGNFGLTVVPKKTHANTKISSTAIRQLILAGNVNLIPHYLGSYYEIKARITNENRLAIDIKDRYILPKPGMYEVKVTADERKYYGKLTIEKEAESDLFIQELERLDSYELSIEFLNRVRVTKAVLV